MLSERHPFVSVVIPVFNDAEALETCLDSFSRQSYPSHRFETVVVDNGSSCDLTDIAARRAGVSLFHCPKPGSCAARDRGVVAAQGPNLAFTDADCQPRHDWLESGVAALRLDPEIAVLGGHIEIVREGAETLSAAELHQNVCAFRQQRYLERQNFFARANVFTYKSVFDRVGPFDERLFSSGDLEWGQRAHAQGYRLVFCPDAVVAHPARATMCSLIQKAIRLSGGQFELRRLRGKFN